MRRFAHGIGAVVTLWSSSAHSAEKGARRVETPYPTTAIISSELSGRDLEYLTAILRVGQLQSYLGEMARERAESDHVKAMGEALHGTQLEEEKLISGLAASNGLRLSSPVSQPKALDELKLLSGSKFDKGCMDLMVESVRRLLVHHEAGQKSGRAEIRTLASQMLPLAKEKLVLIERVAGIADSAASRPAFRKSEPNLSERTPTR